MVVHPGMEGWAWGPGVRSLQKAQGKSIPVQRGWEALFIKTLPSPNREPQIPGPTQAAVSHSPGHCRLSRSLHLGKTKENLLIHLKSHEALLNPVVELGPGHLGCQEGAATLALLNSLKGLGDALGPASMWPHNTGGWILGSAVAGTFVSKVLPGIAPWPPHIKRIVREAGMFPSCLFWGKNCRGWAGFPQRFGPQDALMAQITPLSPGWLEKTALCWWLS